MKQTIKTRVGILCIFWIALVVRGFADEVPANPQATGENKVTAPADNQEDLLEQLRQRYQETCATFDKTGDYGKPYREMIESTRDLIVALLNHWVVFPEVSPDAGTVEQEIQTVFKDLSGHPATEKYSQAKSFIARTTWPLLVGNKVNRKQAEFLVELTKPQSGVRMNDKIAQLGGRTEPLGWDVQAAHILALLRSSNDKKAHHEINMLHKKVSINHARHPKGGLDYGPEAGAERYRDYVDYLQICEAFRALQAAIAGEREGALEHVENARQLREALCSQASQLVAEVARRLEVEKG